MAYPAAHMLTAFGGSLYTNEQWSVSLRSTPNFGDGEGDGSGALPDIVAALEAWWPTNGVVSSMARLGWVKHNRIGLDGKYMASTSNTHFWGTELLTATGGASHPPQVSLVATLETGVTRGLANRGRIFLPVPRFSPSTTGQISAADSTAAATAVANLLTTLNGLTTFGSVTVYSDVREGASRLVTGVSVGRVLDTVRSRRAQLVEDRPPAVSVGGT